ncbi:LOG family protein [Elizabethkingia bruuniana]|uniref:LOG family protein n=1 Tax=Elizabethkingia bruuniana TaxID=1756149 RepID=UPI00241D5B61|nr:TIGR00730 family Rossman fold protein [Elizabethkingia bruuniana]
MNKEIKRITVFCGSSFGTESVYEEQAYELGKILAQNTICLVYGGANVGLMGAVANGVIENGGEAIGVLPHFLKGKEIAHENLTELILVDTMHERKTKMNELSDGVITLPGGYGTLEEFFEMLTWAQLGLHQKPIGILNINGFYDELLAFVQTMVNKGFLKSVNQDMLLVDGSIAGLINKMRNYKAPEVSKWIKKEEL